MEDRGRQPESNSREIFFLDELFKKKILLVSGKGGTGKSTTSALLALRAAHSGKKVLLVENSHYPKLGPLFGLKASIHELMPITSHLSYINLETKKCFEEYVVKYLGLTKLFHRVFERESIKSFLNSIPGLNESMVLGRLYFSCELDPVYDLLIFDAPASGHFLDLMTTIPAILSSGLSGPLVKDIQKVHDFLQDPEKCGIVYVTTVDSLVMSETLDFLPRLIAESPTPLSALIVNKSYQEGSETRDFLEKLESKSDVLKNLTAYIDYKITKNLTNQKLLFEKLSAVGLSDMRSKVFYIPDYGVIENPLSSLL